jgi:predicted O-methyltransferase YrrM
MIQIDDCHIDLIYGLIRAQKPHRLLELGYGTGRTNHAIQRAIQANCRGLLEVVDNFYDWGGSRPEHFDDSGFTFHLSDETEFIVGCQAKYDFIVADGDHHRTDFKVLNLLNPGGIIVFHDVTNEDFPNLRNLLVLDGLLFNSSSIESERCSRGLLVYRCNR